MSLDQYDNPLIARYASAEMSRLWGPQRKFRTWRRLWVVLAEEEAELGLPITPAQIAALKAHVDNIDFAAAERYERKLRHDVMAHVHAYGDDCPEARGIIHLGATSCYVTDNTDLILMRESLELVRARLVARDRPAGDVRRADRELACLGFTHFQPAQPTTVGKRACLWAYDLVQDLAEVEYRLATLKAAARKGPPARRPAFCELFGGDHDKVRRLERAGRRPSSASPPATPSPGRPIRARSTPRSWPRSRASPKARTRRPPICGCCKAARKWKSRLRKIRSARRPWPTSATRCGPNASAGWRGSSSVWNPARAATAATQWLERTLDDSANRRLTLPQAFLAVDAILMLYENVTPGWSSIRR